MTTAPRLNNNQTRLAAYFWSAHKLGTPQIAEKLCVAEACVANSIEEIKAKAKEERREMWRKVRA